MRGSSAGDGSAETVMACVRELLAAGLLGEIGTAGNISVRTPHGFCITPTAVPYRQLDPEQLAVLDQQGEQVGGTRQKSSEWRLHTAIYARRPDIGAIVHLHSPAATALACRRQPLPAIHYAIEQLGGPVPVAPYQTFGSAALADATARVLGNGFAVLMANHGAVVAAPTAQGAVDRAVALEWLCQVYLLAASGGAPVVLSDQEREEARRAWAGYYAGPPRGR